MSQTQTHRQRGDRPESPVALGSRENHWGSDPDETTPGGHSDATGTDPPEYITRNLVLRYVAPICSTTIDEVPNRGFRPHFAWLFDEPIGKGSDLGALHTENEIVELSDPALHLPKQHDTGSRIVEYRQHRLRRRYNPETGYINFGETTSTAIPQFGWEIYEQCVHDYLRARLHSQIESGSDDGLTLTKTDDYLEHAKRFWHDPNLDSEKSLEKFVAFIRKQESGDGQAVSN